MATVHNLEYHTHSWIVNANAFADALKPEFLRKSFIVYITDVDCKIIFDNPRNF